MTQEQLDRIARKWVESVNWDWVRKAAISAVEEYGTDAIDDGWVRVCIENWYSSDLNAHSGGEQWSDDGETLIEDSVYLIGEASRLAPRGISIDTESGDLCAWVRV